MVLMTLKRMTEMLEKPGSAAMAEFVVTAAGSMFKGTWAASLRGSCADEVLGEGLLQWEV